MGRAIVVFAFNACSGVGGKVALSLLSTLGLAQILEHLLSEDAAAFQKVPGIGPKMARRLVTALQEKRQLLLEELGDLGSDLSSPRVGSQTKWDSVAQEALLALEALGYKKNEVEERILMACQENPEDSLEELLQKILPQLAA